MSDTKETSEKHFHSMEVEDVLKALNTSFDGLTLAEVERRRKIYGYNLITIKERFKILKMIIAQFNSFLVFLLIFAGTVSLVLSQFEGYEEGLVDGIAIFAIIILNAIIGFVQEYKSEQALERLKDYFEYKAKVIREGKEYLINTKELVPGDIVLLEEGDQIPADIRLFEIHSLKVNEASLTGESEAVTKNLSLVPVNSTLQQQKNMVFAGTTAVYGRAKGIVVRTGMATEMGKIAESLKTPQELTPLQKRLAHLGRVLGITIIVIVLIVFLVDWLGEHFSWFESFTVAVSLAVSAVPEGLPTAIIIALAVGVSRMAKRKAIVSRLPAVETLGSVDFILSDKTGTITKNEMTVKKVYVLDKLIEVEGVGYSFKGDLILDKNKITDPSSIAALKMLLEGAAYCNNAYIGEDTKEKGSIIGDPTELALLVLARKGGVTKQLPRVYEIFFDSQRKRMTTVHEYDENNYVAYMKGSPLIVLDRCSKVLIDGEVEELNENYKKKINEHNISMAKEALRILAFAYKIIPKDEFTEDEDIIENDMIFLGLAGMIDPPREEVAEALARCKSAGITTIMVTGDQPTTAEAVARQVGLISAKRSDVITGEILQTMSDQELKNEIETVAVFARMSPRDKLRIVKILQEMGHVVAVTGDGVNDAPALRKADIGVGMGITGTDVTKETADIILTDDNFATLVNGVEEGRGIFKNMLSFLRFLLGANFDEILTVFIITTVFHLPTPLLAIQILWLNLITDGLPAIALSFDPYDREQLMSQKPRKGSFLKDIYIFALIAGAAAFVSTSAAYLISYYYLYPGLVEHAQTLAFTTTLLFELVVVWFVRSSFDDPFMAKNPFNNLWLIGSVIAGVVLQILIIYVPLGHLIFHTTTLGIYDWMIALGFIVSSMILLVIAKMINLKIKKKPIIIRH